MMRSLLVAMLVFGLSLSNAFAGEPKNVVLHVNQPGKIPLLVDTIRFLQNRDSDLRFHVVVNGPAVSRMSRRYDYADELVKHSVWVGVCSLGMFRNSVAREDLAEGVQFLEESGIVALVNFQEQGYTYIKI